MTDLVPLPVQPEGVPWPGPGSDDWPRGDLPAQVDLGPLLEETFGGTGPLAVTHAVLIVHRGKVVVERYAGALPGEPPVAVTSETPLLSWSMAKSFLHAVLGILVGDGLLTIDTRAPVPRWSSVDDPRGAITVRDLLEMRDGLDFNEDYLAAGTSDVIAMLFGAGRDDVAAFAEDRASRGTPGEAFSYSSGTSNVLSGIVSRLLGPGPPTERFIRERLLDAIDARSARPVFDAAGTWVASTYIYATACDFLRFALLYLRGGTWNGMRLVEPDWVDSARRKISDDPTDADEPIRYGYGRHFWVLPDAFGTFAMLGYSGQSVTISPALDLIVLRMGDTSAEFTTELRSWRQRVVDAFSQV